MTRAPRPLWHHLLAWVFTALVLSWAVLAAVAYYTGYHEADEVNDGQLVATAELVLRQLQNAPAAPAPTDTTRRARGVTAYAPELHVLAWQEGRLVWDTHGLAPHLAPGTGVGHRSLTLDTPGGPRAMRAFFADGPSGARVVVMIDTGRRKALGRDIAEHIVRPALVLLPLVALLLGWALWRGLRPLERLSVDIEALDLNTGQTLAPRRPYRELQGTVRAINTLVERLQAQLLRERRFASDVAHELRTPLTSLVLQSRLARGAGDPDARQQALEQVEREALHSGRILAQLLELARAEGLDRQARETVDLCALARGVVAELAPTADAQGQELALEAPDAPLVVRAHSTMLALALRNLVDNAIRHTPAGTQIEVRVTPDGQGGAELSVCDDGQRAGALAPQPQAQPGLGVGLTLVRRIADWHGIGFVQGQAPAPHTTRFALVWSAAPR